MSRRAAATVASGDGWELRRADCLRHLTLGLASIPDGSVDHVITDPPYDEHTHAKQRQGHRSHGTFPERQASQKAAFSRKRELGFAALSLGDMVILAGHFARIARRWVEVFCTLEMIGDPASRNGTGWRAALEHAGLEYVRTMIWHKLGSTPQFSGDRPAVAVEAIVLAHHMTPGKRPGSRPKPCQKRWNSHGKHGYYAHAIVLDRNGVDDRAAHRVHTTQKPLALMRELVEDFTDPGELIADPFAGSGTTGIACRMLGRRFVGWEREIPDYQTAARRIAGEGSVVRPGQIALFPSAIVERRGAAAAS